MTAARGEDRRITWVDLPAARPSGAPAVREAIGAGFTRGGPDVYPVPDAAAFEAGGAADVMPPCSVLAELTGQALEAGLERLTDDELIGVLRAARRVVSWQSAVELAAAEELAARRRAEGADPDGVAADSSGGPRPDERASAELAAALTLTSRAADVLMGVAFGVTRLPDVAAALARGEIDLARATVFAEELSAVGWLRASVISGLNLMAARGLTTSQLRALLRREVLAADPDAVRRRQRAARADARVECWGEHSGNSAIAGRELPAAQALLADRHVGALATAMKAAGMPGTLDQIRAEVFLALLSGQSPEQLLSAAFSADEVIPVPDREDLLPGPPPPDLPPPAGPAHPELPGAGSAGRGPGLSWPSGPVGSVHLTMPWSTWLGLGNRPGEVAGHGPMDSWACRDVAEHLRGSGGTRYCVTVTTDKGFPLGHACAGSPPPGTGPPGTGPPGTGPPGREAAAWLAGLKFEWLEYGKCTHPRETAAYRPGPLLDHLLKIRNPTCTAPGCRRPSVRCDVDHVIPYHLGGRTCECNCHPACRRHHRCKGSNGWHLDMPEPGVLAWRLPHGRTYRTTPSPYPV